MFYWEFSKDLRKIPFTEKFLSDCFRNLYTLISYTQVGPQGCSKEKPFSKNSEKNNNLQNYTSVL